MITIALAMICVSVGSSLILLQVSGSHAACGPLQPTNVIRAESRSLISHGSLDAVKER
ncbi:MAG: hypothetical protein AAGF55_01040 [Pseudomonadota bacterium]